jgi:hypothetical protein
LLDIPLDRENARDVMIPTISLVNYVLSRQLLLYADHYLLLRPVTTGDPQSYYPNLIASYEKAALDAATANKMFPPDIFHLPFDPDYECQVVYVQALGKSIYDIAVACQKIAGVDTIVDPDGSLALSYFQLSGSKSTQLKAPTLCLDCSSSAVLKDGADPPASLADSTTFSSNSATFCKRTQIRYSRLGELLHLSDASSIARSYVIKLDRKNWYVNKATDAAQGYPLQLSLTDNRGIESLQYLTAERLKRLGQLDFMANRMNITVDEMELVFCLVQGCNVNAFYLIDKFKKQLNLLLIDVIQFLCRIDSPLFPAVLNVVCPLPSTNTSAQIDLANLRLHMGIVAKVSVSKLADLQKDPSINLYVAMQSTAFMCRVTGVTVDELFLIYANSDLSKVTDPNPGTMDQVNAFIKSAYELGQLKKFFKRTSTELCQLVCFAYGDTIKPADNRTVLITGLGLLLNGSAVDNTAKPLTRSSLELRLITLLKLVEVNQIAIDQDLQPEDLIRGRFGILSTDHTQMMNAVQQGLLQPFFRNITRDQLSVVSTDSALVPATVTPTTPGIVMSTADNQSLTITRSANPTVNNSTTTTNVVQPATTAGSLTPITSHCAPSMGSLARTN